MDREMMFEILVIFFLVIAAIGIIFVQTEIAISTGTDIRLILIGCGIGLLLAIPICAKILYRVFWLSEMRRDKSVQTHSHQNRGTMWARYATRKQWQMMQVRTRRQWRKEVEGR